MSSMCGWRGFPEQEGAKKIGGPWNFAILQAASIAVRNTGNGNCNLLLAGTRMTCDRVKELGSTLKQYAKRAEVSLNAS